ncbi:MAG: hypothetical protein CVU05_11070 [Bacteroidetes bacterium HGW-Bacteroidetes-21]|nr:MAG: hypothetical protein CVU05_11070 [Bacteroidetes bacterium HGW-Bacteroidetes-21]
MKKAIGKFLLKGQLKNRVRHKRFHNFHSAKKVGILFNASDSKIYAESKILLNYFTQKKIKTEGLGFADKDQMDSFYKTYTGFQFFCSKDFSFLGLPKSQVVRDFYEQEFDILIDLSLSENPLFSTICSLSRASFIVGSVKSRINEYDLLIDCNDGDNPEAFCIQMKHYLESINT